MASAVPQRRSLVVEVDGAFEHLPVRVAITLASQTASAALTGWTPVTEAQTYDLVTVLSRDLHSTQVAWTFGASQSVDEADTVLVLVIDAQDGPLTSTTEVLHRALLRGMRSVVVALTRLPDFEIDPELDELTAVEVRDLLDDVGFDGDAAPLMTLTYGRDGTVVDAEGQSPSVLFDAVIRTAGRSALRTSDDATGAQSKAQAQAHVESGAFRVLIEDEPSKSDARILGYVASGVIRVGDVLEVDGIDGEWVRIENLSTSDGPVVTATPTQIVMADITDATTMGVPVEAELVAPGLVTRSATISASIQLLSEIPPPPAGTPLDAVQVRIAIGHREFDATMQVTDETAFRRGETTHALLTVLDSQPVRAGQQVDVKLAGITLASGSVDQDERPERPRHDLLREFQEIVYARQAAAGLLAGGAVETTSSLDRAIGFYLGGKLRYPVFQFEDVLALTAHPIVAELSEQLGGDEDAEGVISWWLTPNVWLNGRSPSELLAEGNAGQLRMAANQLRNDSW